MPCQRRPMLAIPVLAALWSGAAAVALRERGRPLRNSSGLEDLWDGLDEAAAGPHPADFGRAPRDTRPARRSFVLMAPQDSGSNLLEALIMRNFPVRSSLHKFWKHSYSNDTDSLYKLITKHWMPPERSVLVMIVRSPLSQITSWRQTPYTMEACANRSYADMTQPCAVRIGTGAGPLDRHAVVQFSSTMDAYNQYLRMYSRLEREGRFQRSVLLLYENVVTDPVGALRELARTFGARLPPQLDTINASAKGVGFLRRDQAVDKIRARSYLGLVGRADLEALCGQGDRDLWGKFHVAAWNRSYRFDCDGLGP